MPDFPEDGDDYVSWEELPGQDHESRSTVEDEEDSDIRELIDADFIAEEKRREEEDQELSENLHRIQFAIEMEFHENNNAFIYGIFDAQVFPVIAAPGGDPDCYAAEDWFLDKAEDMDPLEFYLESSAVGEQIESRMSSMREGMPEGLRNRAYEILDGASTDLSEFDTDEIEGSYLLPKLSSQEYSSM